MARLRPARATGFRQLSRRFPTSPRRQTGAQPTNGTVTVTHWLGTDGPSPRPFCPGCIISTRGYDFREGQPLHRAQQLHCAGRSAHAPHRADHRVFDRCGFDASCAQTLHEDWPVRGVPIPDEVSRRMVPRESLGDLARDPLRGRICCYAKRYPKSSSMSHDNKTIENLERDRWQDKKVDRCNAVAMVAEKRPPALRRWPRAAAHIPSDCRLSDIEAELEQFTMNAWCAPERVRAAHFGRATTVPSRRLAPRALARTNRSAWTKFSQCDSQNDKLRNMVHARRAGRSPATSYFVTASSISISNG